MQKSTKYSKHRSVECRLLGVAGKFMIAILWFIIFKSFQ